MKSVKFFDSKKHNQKIIKTCEVCKVEYHPRKNGYEMTSRFCSQECTREGRSLIAFK